MSNELLVMTVAGDSVRFLDRRIEPSEFVEIFEKGKPDSIRFFGEQLTEVGKAIARLGLQHRVEIRGMDKGVMNDLDRFVT